MRNLRLNLIYLSFFVQYTIRYHGRLFAPVYIALIFCDVDALADFFFATLAIPK